jgi:hypothetical protein
MSLRHPCHSREESCKLRDVEDACPHSRTLHRTIVITIEPSVIVRAMPDRAPLQYDLKEAGSGAHACGLYFIILANKLSSPRPHDRRPKFWQPSFRSPPDSGQDELGLQRSLFTEQSSKRKPQPCLHQQRFCASQTCSPRQKLSLFHYQKLATKTSSSTKMSHPPPFQQQRPLQPHNQKTQPWK